MGIECCTKYGNAIRSGRRCDHGKLSLIRFLNFVTHTLPLPYIDFPNPMKVYKMYLNKHLHVAEHLVDV
jgi:hypothetical protein